MGYYYQAAYGGLIIYVIIIVAIACVFGFATKKIIENKGYSENWFWWGFFFWLIAVLVALSKPDANNSHSPHNTPINGDDLVICPRCEAQNTPGNIVCWKCGQELPVFEPESGIEEESRVSVNTTDSHSVSSVNALPREDGANKAAIQEKDEKQELENIKMIKAYKDLLDSGAITQEEFDKKKAELLNL